MQDVLVDKNQLIRKLIENLVKHEEEYKATQAGYETFLLAKLKQAQKILKTKPESFDLLVFLAQFKKKPVSYVQKYQLAIQALEWSVDDNIRIDYYAFDKYVNDNWDWKADFEASKTAYFTLKST